MHSKLLNELLDGVGIDLSFNPSLQLESQGHESLPSCFAVTELAATSMLTAASALAEYCHADARQASHQLPTMNDLTVNRRLASLWFDKSMVAQDWKPGGLWDDIAGDYACADGWIRLHTNAPHHKKAAMQVVLGEALSDNPGNGEPTIKQRVTEAIRLRHKDELEQSIVDVDGCAAAMRSIADWQLHAQGRAVAGEPLVHWEEGQAIQPVSTPVSIERPLNGIRVLDLTRVLAGPVSTRFLAAFGAEVLRIDPIDWNEPAVIPEVTLGKRCAHLDLKSDDGRAQLLALLDSADVLVHGYRPGAMEGLGLSTNVLRKVNPALIEVSLCAYGWTGPWATRRGFDSLVQMSCGIADEGMRHYATDKPQPLPVQALDHATGYLMAAAALHALALRRKAGRVLQAKLSLARTANTLLQYPQSDSRSAFKPMGEADINNHLEHTSWGMARRVSFPLTIDGVKISWDHPASDLRSDCPKWL